MHKESLSLTLQKILAGILGALMLMKVMDLLLDHVIVVPETATTISASGPAAAPAAPKPEEPLPVRLAKASADHGKDLTSQCQSCHTFNQGGRTLVGPNLYGVVGRAKATEAGFSYSDAIKKLGGNWGYDDLDKWLTSPQTDAPGTKMTFAGLRDGQDRADVIAYLKSISPSAPPFPTPAPAEAAPAAAAGSGAGTSAPAPGTPAK